MGLTFDMSKVLEKLDNLEKKAKNDMSKNALNKGADIMKSTIKGNVPIDTSALQEAIDKSNAKGGINPTIKVGLIDADADVMRYGNAQNFGTENMIGKKFMERSFIESKDEVIEAIKESIVNDLLE
ncbi:HK97 gp10 family phage protein [Romboutsia sedimentorum]|uniref:HK97-gp10 family putative phage morphogenesis protein n=1 Tax=Romboutsia sedimentorum TaxID=1368474 RepID=UPI0024DE5F20|nr:HK97-gp10 family putative phage morphogenesis protein [Romboutsia sedimentorum]MDK2587476.1 HK97 gp10 family phage protein [Romboutsia sedimentorum]